MTKDGINNNTLVQSWLKTNKAARILQNGNSKPHFIMYFTPSDMNYQLFYDRELI
jgi:hypothetical protein